MTRPVRIADLKRAEIPLSEEFRLCAIEWADAENAASLMEELKSVTVEQRKSALIAERGDMPDSRAERIVKSDPEWETYIREMCAARAKANEPKLKLAWIRMRHSEWVAADASARAEFKLGSQTP